MPITRRQPEFGKPFGEYLASFTTASRITGGVAKAAEWAGTFDDVERRFGVPREIILAIWGVETSYGRVASSWDTIRSLATLAHAGFRPPYFRDELIVARNPAGRARRRDKMKSSWAGAMGQTQFMPSNFMTYAIDHSGDGRRDIWTNVPDVLGLHRQLSARADWTPGLPWGFEVTVRAGFDLRRSRGTFREWRRSGCGAPTASDLPARRTSPTCSSRPAVRAGLSGHREFRRHQALQQFRRLRALRRPSGRPHPRARPGARSLARRRPPAGRGLTHRAAARVAARGYKVRNFTGHFDFDLRDHIRSEQRKLGMVADGHPTAALLQRLGAPPMMGPRLARA